MGDLPFRRMFLYVIAIVSFSAICAYAADSYAASRNVDISTTISIGFIATLAVPGFFVARWWLRTAKAAGLPTIAGSNTNAISFALIALGAMIAGIAVNFALFNLTHSRLAEFAVGIVMAALLFPIIAAAYARENVPKPQETKSLRLLAILNAAPLPLILA